MIYSVRNSMRLQHLAVSILGRIYPQQFSFIKDPFPQSKVLDIMKEIRGAHFDSDIFDTFLELVEDFRQIILSHVDFEEEREIAGQ